MARRPTRYSRVSVGWVDSARSLVDVDAGDTGTAFSVTGGASVDDLTVTGGVTSTSAITATGGVEFASGDVLTTVIKSTVSLGGAAVTGHDSVVSNYAMNDAAVGDLVLLQPSSKWSGAYHDIRYEGRVSTVSLLELTLANSAVTDITPDAINWEVVLLRFS